MLKKLIKPIFAATLLFPVFSSAEVITQQQLIQQTQKEVKSIDTQELVSLLKENPNIQLIDVRNKSDILAQGGYIKTNNLDFISRDKLEFMIEDTVKADETFVVYCYTGNISLLAAKQLKDMGYKNVIHYKDSYKGWSEAKQKISSLDFYPESPLYNKLKKVSDGVYTSIGATQPPRYENNGHNNNLGFIEGKDFGVVWNASGNYMLAKALHEEIKKVSNKPIKYVILENSQSHAMLGSNYWKEQGATIIAHEISKQELAVDGEQILARHARIMKDKIIGTKIVLPDETFSDKMEIDLGNKKIELLYFGHAHEYDDIALWLPNEKILFAGDLAFHERMLPIFKITDTAHWIELWDNIEALNAKIVIPGHGDVTDMPTVTKYTKDYLIHMREKVTEVLDNGGSLADAYKIDQEDYRHLDTFKELAVQNASLLFERMEFE